MTEEGTRQERKLEDRGKDMSEMDGKMRGGSERTEKYRSKTEVEKN